MPKTLAIRLDDALHAQASLMAQLLGVSLTELIRTAIDTYVESKRTDPDLAAKADSIRQQIEADAANRQAAIETLFTNDEPAPAAKRTSRSRTKQPDGE